jgi:hypothetical protein
MSLKVGSTGSTLQERSPWAGSGAAPSSGPSAGRLPLVAPLLLLTCSGVMRLIHS